MAAYQLKTFADIYTAILEELKIQSSDTTSLNRIKRAINMAYLNEIVPAEQWKWLRGEVAISHDAAISAGTATVTAGSNTVTLTTAPAFSRRGYWFAVTGYNELYRIAQHTAGSVTLILEAPYTGTSSSTATYKIWTDKLALPADCRDVIKVTHDFMKVPLEGNGIQKFREIALTAPKAESRPAYYSTGDFVDPAPYSTITSLPALSTRASNGLVKTLVYATSVASLISVGDRIEVSLAGDRTYNGQWVVSSVSTTTITYTGLAPLSEDATADATLTLKSLSVESAVERYRELMIYPSIFSSRTTLHVDYIKTVAPLEDDEDEPLIPIEERVILVYAGAQWAWSTIARNPTEAKRNFDLYNARLAKMSGKLDDSTDFPVLRPSKIYLGSKRQNSRQRDSRYNSMDFGGSANSARTVTGTALMAAQFNSAGELEASSTITSTELSQLNGILSSAVGISDTQTLTNKTLTAPTLTGLTTFTYLQSSSSNVADAGSLRLSKTESVAWRNNAASGNNLLTTDTSDQLTYNGSVFLTSTGTVPDAALAVSYIKKDGSRAFTGHQSMGSFSLQNVLFMNSPTANTAGAGLVRLAKTDTVNWRNNANTGDMALGIDLNNELIFKDYPLRLSVTDFGATGNGVTDDTAAIQACIDAANPTIGPKVRCEIMFPASRQGYLITDTITIPSTMRLRGDNKINSLLVFSGANAVPMITVDDAANFVEIDHLGFDNVGSATHAIFVTGSHTYIHDVFSKPTNAFATAIISNASSPDHTNHTSLKKCFLGTVDTGEETPIGVLFQDGFGHRIDDCVFSGLPISVKINDGGDGGSLQVSITNSYWECWEGTDTGYPGSATAVGILIAGGYGINVSGCGFEYTSIAAPFPGTMRAIEIAEVEGCNISGNNFLMHGETGSAGIKISGGSDVDGVFISGNNFEGFAGSGIEVTASGSNYFVGYNNQELTSLLVSDSFNPRARAGTIRLPNADLGINWRDSTDASNLALTVSSSNRLTFNGVNIPSISSTDTLTNKTIDADSNTITNIKNADIKAAAAIAVNKLAALTASRAVVSDASGFISAATTTSTQIGYLSAATGTTGTTSTNIVFSTSPSLTTPTIAGGALSGTFTGAHTYSGITSHTAGISVGTGSADSTTIVAARTDQSGLTTMQLRNSHASGQARMGILGVNGAANITAYSSITKVLMEIASGFTGGFGIDMQGANPLELQTNSVVRLKCDGVGNVVIGTAALSTTATDGFFYITTMAGAPTGNSTDFSGRLPMVYDTSNDKLWINTSGTTWKGVVLS